MADTMCFAVTATTMSGLSKRIEGIQPDSPLESLWARVADEFGMPRREVKLYEGSRAFTARELCLPLRALGIGEGSALSILRHSLQIGVDDFNRNPTEGIEHLRQNGWDDPKVIAELFENPEIGFDRGGIGEYLSEDKPFNKNILHALVNGQNFHGDDLDVSLRAFLSIFRLPGEAQKIDRLMQTFAEKYCLDNPEAFAHSDCAYVLSFSLIMLHTDLFNPLIKAKITKAEFVRNNRGINGGGDLPQEYIEKLFESVSAKPFSPEGDSKGPHDHLGGVPVSKSRFWCAVVAGAALVVVAVVVVVASS